MKDSTKTSITLFSTGVFAMVFFSYLVSIHTTEGGITIALIGVLFGSSLLLLGTIYTIVMRVREKRRKLGKK